MAGVQCFGCGTEFGFFKREHDCKHCGMLFCSSCTSHSLVLPNQGPKKTKVCDQCFKKLQRRPKPAPELSITEKKELNDLSRNTQTPEGNLSQTRNLAGNQVPNNIPTRKYEDGNENVSQDPDDEIRQRLKELRSDESGETAVNTDDKLGEKFENLTGRKATCMQKSNITTPIPTKSEVEQTEDLMKQMMDECKIDESLADSKTTVTEKEIEERLARLKDMDPSEFGKPQVPEWDSDEDEETASARYLRQVIEEAALEKKLEAMGDDSSSASSKKKQGKTSEQNFQPDQSSSIFSREYEVDSNEEELPWCCICNANAVLRCSGCDGDLYCRRCFKEGHSREDYDDHEVSTYRPPRKK